jgi:lipopolysaccharide transport system ATP-binding protein
MAAAISVEHLGKYYRVSNGQQRCGYRTLRETLTGCARRALQRWRRRTGPPPSEDFWALRDVSFSVPAGEVVGIIGRNGAGKSTLLKILSRVARPSRGHATVRGRVGSLLEVGTGFHPELTGRENIYLNGSILGMSRREITRRFDEIVAFAEVERFLDTPVKRYSSGMYVRLAFAVAAHMEPEILVVDEVLAVGDAQFQKKCLGKMKAIGSGGRTILFVSHQMGAVQRLCTQAILLERGRVAEAGPTESVVVRYLSNSQATVTPGDWVNVADLPREAGSNQARFTGVRHHSTAAVDGHPRPDGTLEVAIIIDSDQARQVPSLAVTFYDRFNTKLVNADTLSLGQAVALKRGLNEIRLQIDSLHLNPGSYTLGLWLAAGSHVYDHVPEASVVEIVDSEELALGGRPNCDGLVTCPFQCVSPGVA